MENKVIVDGKIQKDVKVFSNSIIFNLSIITGTYKTFNDNLKNRYTFIKCMYKGEVTPEIEKLLSEDSYIHLDGKLDSEHYKSKTGKIVYNKIIVAEKVTPLSEEEVKNYGSS